MTTFTFKHRDNCGCDDPTGPHCEPKPAFRPAVNPSVSPRGMSDFLSAAMVKVTKPMAWQPNEAVDCKPENVNEEVIGTDEDFDD